MSATTTSIDFREVFADAPEGRLTGAPATVPGTLTDLIYGRPEGHIIEFVAPLAGQEGKFTVSVEPPKGPRDSGIVMLQFTPVVRDAADDLHRVRVMMPGIDVRGRLHLSMIGSTAPLLYPAQIPAEQALLSVAAQLAVELDTEAETALAPQVEARRADWEAGAEKRQAEKDWQAATVAFYEVIDGILEPLVGETIRVKTDDHGYRSTGVLAVLTEDGRGYRLTLPRGSRGKAEHRFWHLIELEVEQPDGKFLPVELPKRPAKPGVLRD